METGILVAVATIGTAIAVTRMAKKAHKGGVASRTGIVLARELRNLALNKVVAGSWKRPQLKHRRALKRACACPWGLWTLFF